MRGIVICVTISMMSGLGCDGGPFRQGRAQDQDVEKPVIEVDIPDVRLTIEPEGALLEVLAGEAASLDYRVDARFEDGSTMDVTTLASFSSSDGAVGFFRGSTFAATGARGGFATVRATYRSASVATSLTVRLTRTLFLGAAPKDAALRFTGPEDPARSPAMVYPPSGVLVPPNLSSLNYQWNNGGNDLFELRLENDVTDFTIFTTETSYQVDADGWAWIAETNRGSQVDISLRGTGAAGGTGVGRAPDAMMGFGEEDLRGALYYWTTTQQGIIRYDFGEPDQPAELFYTPTEDKGHCVGCHTLSRDGSRMAFTFDGGNQSAGILDVASRALLAGFGSYNANFHTYDPSGELLVAVFQGVLTLRDGGTGAALGTVPTEGYATHPNWSPDGGALVYTQPGLATTYDWSFSMASIRTVSWDGSLWGAPTTLILSAGENNYYPSFSPDGEWILFNRSTGDSYADPDAELFAVRLAAPDAVFALTVANLAPNLTNSWPRWSPFVERAGDKGTLMWFAFSSMRAYGNQLAANTRPQIWMAAFEPGRADLGVDPSTPAFWVPFQELSTSNHIPEWTEEIPGTIK